MEINKIIKDTARDIFQIKKLRPIQRKVITNILTNDIENRSNSLLVLLQTGGGKSICFLLPSLLVEGITVIVYPLLALMRDQKKRLDFANINSIIIEGGQSYKDRKKRFNIIDRKEAKIIIINPEVLLNKSVMNQLRKYQISLFVIDEAHTICEWGLSFRPAYLNLGRQIQTLHIKQILAFTATANKQTLNILSKYLFFYSKYTIIRGGVDRENIIYHKRFTLAKNREIANILIDDKSRPAIVFTRTRESTKILYKNFNEYGFNIPTFYYHAGLSKLEKNRVEREFFKSNNSILFSTIAFGLGMDKSNIRVVIHYSIIDTNILSFLQESGRAGRDGELASSIVLIGSDEINTYNKRNDNNELLKIYLSNKCIREELTNYMGESIDKCSGCDICEHSIINNFDGLNSLVSILIFHPFLYSKNEITMLLSGNKEYNLLDPGYSILNSWKEKDIIDLINQALNLSILIELHDKIALNYLKWNNIRTINYRSFTNKHY